MPSSDRVNSVQSSLNKVLEQRVDILGKQRDAELKVAAISKAVTASQEGMAASYKNVARGADDANVSTGRYLTQLVRTSKIQSAFAKTMGEATSYFKDQAKTLIRDFGPALTFGALAMRAFTLSSQSNAKATKLFIDSNKRIDSVSMSYKAIVARGREIVEVNKANRKMSILYGESIEYVTSVSDKWAASLMLSEITEESRASIEKLTASTFLLSRAMGIDAVELQEKAADRVNRYGEAADEAQQKLAGVHFQVVAVNEEMSETMGKDKAHLWARDFTSLVDKAASETRSYAQDLGQLSAAMMYSAMQAEKAGATYDQQLDSAAAFGKFLTGGVDDAFKVMVGEKQLKKLMANPEQFMAQFDQKTQVQLQQQLDAKEGGRADIFVIKAIQDILSTTDQGQADLIDEINKGGGDKMHLLVGALGEEAAAQAADTLRRGGTGAEIMEGIRKGKEAGELQAKIAAMSPAEQLRALRSTNEKDAEIAAKLADGRDPLLAADILAGQIAAQAEDPRAVAAAAGVAGVAAGLDWIIAKHKDIAGDQEAIDAAADGGMAGMNPMETAFTRALSHFATNDAIRVTDAGAAAPPKDAGGGWGDWATGMRERTGGLLGGVPSFGGAAAALEGSLGGLKAAKNKAILGGVAAAAVPAFIGTGLVAAGTAGIVGGTASAYDVTTTERLEKLRKSKGGPLNPDDIDPQMYKELISTMSGDVTAAEQLAADGTIGPAMLADIQKAQEAAIAPGAPTPGAAPAPLMSGTGLLPNAVNKLPGAATRARELVSDVMGVDVGSGDIILRIKNGLSIPASYDAYKLATQ